MMAIWKAWMLLWLGVFTQKSFSTAVFDFVMPGVIPIKKDHYICTIKNMRVNETELYITQFEAVAQPGRAHHIILYGCAGRESTEDTWDCGEGAGNICRGAKIMFAWAKNALPTILPQDVGFRVGGRKSGVNYLVLQVHYALPLKNKDSSGLRLTMTTKRQKYIGGIFILSTLFASIPAHKPKHSMDSNCQFISDVDIHPFAYRVHAHMLGTVITGYKFNGTHWTSLGKGNPNWPQAFYPMDRIYSISNSDYVAARCTYNSMSREKTTYIGPSSSDEMCNFYIMYYTDGEKGLPYFSCQDVSDARLVELLPPGNDVPLPRNSELEDHAMIGMVHATTQKASTTQSVVEKMESETKPVADKKDDYNPAALDYSDDDTQQSQPIGNFLSELDQTFKGNVDDYGGDVGVGINPEGRGRGQNRKPNLPILFDEVTGWPNGVSGLGQVTAIAINHQGHVVIFHRGNRVWDSLSFDLQDRFRNRNKPAIAVDTIITIHSDNGNIMSKWGKNMFYMPHGLHIDPWGNIWTTDVALHQVMKFPSLEGSKEPVLTLGERFVPGSDVTHFCKPSSVAVGQDGNVFVADGYCNSRIMKFSADGRLLLRWGQQGSSLFGLVGNNQPPPYTFDIPHKVVILDDRGLVCVADRENGRVQCFHSSNGTFYSHITAPEFGGRVFSIDYLSDKSGRMFVVNGPKKRNAVQGFVVNFFTEQIIGIFKPRNKFFKNPHDVVVNFDGSCVYVAEIGPNRVWKFHTTGSNHKTGKKVLTSESDVNHSKHSDSPTEANPAVNVVLSHSNDHQSHQTKSESGVSMSKLESELKLDDTGLTASLVILALLAIPVLCMVFVTVVIRLKKQGRFKALVNSNGKSKNERFNIGNMLYRHKGFDKVNMEESDGDVDISDSDVEEFTASGRSTIPIDEPANKHQSKTQAKQTTKA